MITALTRTVSSNSTTQRDVTPLRAGADVRIHETRRWRDDDVVCGGIPRFRPAVASIQAALWSRTAREAALMLCTPVQQRIVTVDGLGEALSFVRRAPRLRLLREVLDEIGGGVHSLNELDFARRCRDAGLPEPDRQVLVHRPAGSAYLDVRWTRWNVVAEIDGVGHLDPAQWLADDARHNDIALMGGTVLRIPSLGFRVDGDHYIDTVRRALHVGGWPG